MAAAGCQFRILPLLLLLLGMQARFLDAEEIIITPQGSQVKKLNSRLILTCTLVDYSPGNSPPEITWIDPNNQPITSSRGRVFIEADGSSSLKLYIKGIQTRDAGTYTCDVVAPSGAHVTGELSLSIFEDITFDDHPLYFKHEIGSTALLECTASGQPEPSVSWRFDRHKIPTDTAKYRYDERGLIVNNVNPADSGTYECRAEVDSQGTLKIRQVTLDILSPPAITKGPSSRTVIKGNDVSLECKAHGNPDVEFEWHREQMEDSGMANLKVKLAESSDTYHIKAATEADEGKYYCKVSNSLGSKEVSADINVIIPPTMKDIPHKVVMEGHHMILPCEVSGDPLPTIRWKKTGSSRNYVEGIQPNDARITVDNTQPGINKLIIHDVQRSYAGQFTCTAESAAGTVSKEGGLTVEFMPTVNATEMKEYGWPGQIRNFTCVGYGSPLPTLTWYKSGQYVTESETYAIYNIRRNIVSSTLQITIKEKESWVFGPYMCVAKNVRGHATETVHLSEAMTPDMPRDVTVAKETSTSVTITAKKPKKNGGLALTSWGLKYEITGEPESVKEFFFGPEDKGSFTMEVTDLDPGTTYAFYLSAGNPAGFGTPAKFQVETPKQADVPNMNNAKSSEKEKNEEKHDKNHLGGNHTVLSVKTGRGNTGPKQEEVTSDDDSHVGTAVGATIGLGILIALIIGAVLWYRRRSHAPPSRKGSETNLNKVTVDMNAAKDVDSIKMHIRRPSDNPPEVPPHRNLKSPIEARKHAQGPAMTSTPRSPKPNRLSEEVPATAVSCISNNPNSIQKQAWDSMLHAAAAMEEEEESRKANEATPMMDSDLPPPPAFLLENNENEAAQDDATSYQDILDGYHSEDNVDDDSGYIDVNTHTHVRGSS